MNLIGQGAAGLVLGLAGGLVHFLSLAWNLKLLLSGRTWRALGLQGLRLAMTATLLAGLAHWGVFAVLTGLAGLLVARYLTLRTRKVTTS
ncbi:F1-F0 ATPase (N-ATPase) AtpR subunit [Modicisalibacter xianhensis]|uniref:F1-F0 ATPase (N-ATPase) AtpR subunit n=1 Tax=Modicisalibacter xianhensis TaxID=442341 RepID=A0A4R8FZH4_9GAMM|nr:ATP synthase subunit I [Halomonas xianhensis]TDX31080.1 F1-F0 ATPase (N-ATPase) AtpR subunit [Halomonas xianhensis]